MGIAEFLCPCVVARFFLQQTLKQHSGLCPGSVSFKLPMRGRTFLLAADIETLFWTVRRVQPTWTQNHRPMSKRLEHRLREKFIVSDSSTGIFFLSNVCCPSCRVEQLVTRCKNFTGLPIDPNKAAKGARRWHKLQYQWEEGDQASYDQSCCKFWNRSRMLQDVHLYIKSYGNIHMADWQEIVRERASQFLSTVHR